MNLRSIKVKIAGPLVAMAAVLVVSSGVVSVGLSYKALREQKQQDELVIAGNIAVQVDEVLSKARKAVEALARMPSIESMDPDRQVDALTIVTQTTELIDGIVITDTNGVVRAVDAAEMNTERVMPPENLYRSFARTVAKTRRSMISDVYHSKTSEVCVALNAPILRDGACVGMVSGGILLRNHTMGGIDNIRIGRTGYAYVVDSTGDVVLHPQRERELENFSNNPAVKAFLSQRSGVTEFTNADGLNILAAFAPVQEAGWGVIVRQPTDESYALADHIRSTQWILLWSSLGLALGLGFFLANRILRPVSALVEASKRIEAGDLSTSLPPAGNDELGELARAFNRMAASLRARLEEIERAHEKVLHTQHQLSRSERLASVGQMAAGLAHEINNPINIIMGFAELLLRRMEDGNPLRVHVEEIEREANRCRRLVQNLLDLSRQREPGTQPCDLNDIALRTAALLQEQARGRGVVIQARAAGNPAVVKGDKDQIRQVLLNIILNSIQAMPAGGTIAVEVTAGDHVTVSVRDSGPGIPADQREKVFDPFFTTKDTGTGLGLAVSHAIVERHGGRIEVDCPAEGGTVFTVVLPVEREAALAHG